MKSVRIVPGMAILVMFVVDAAYGQSVAARPNTNEVFVGEPFGIDVSVTNPTTATAPTAPKADGLEVRMLNRNPSLSQQVQIINGRMSRQDTYTYAFEATANRIGVVDIPPFEVNDAGKVLRSRPIRVVVKAPPSTPDLICRIECKGGPRVWVGQRVDVTLEIWVRRFSQHGMDLDERSMWSLIDASRTSLGVFGADANPRVGEAGRPNDEGERVRYWVYKLDTTIYPAKPGPLDFGDIQIGYHYPVSLTRNVFGQLQLERDRKISQRPELPVVEVVGLPREGRPADFNGAVGVYSIQCQAKPTEVAVGDPVTLILSIRGSGALERLSAPRLSEVAALTKDFEVSTESPPGDVEGGTKNFVVTIRPLREEVTQIPPIPISYFNSEKESYETSWSEPIALKVHPAQRLTMSHLNTEASGGGVLMPLVEATDGLLANETNPRRVLGAQEVRVGGWTWVLLSGGPMAYVGAWFIRRRSFGQNPRLSRRRAALRVARGALADASRLGPAQVRAALVGYVADRFDVPRGLTRNEAVEVLLGKGVAGEFVSEIDGLLQSIEAVEYGGVTHVDVTTQATKAHQLLDQLERSKP